MRLSLSGALGFLFIFPVSLLKLMMLLWYYLEMGIVCVRGSPLPMLSRRASGNSYRSAFLVLGPGILRQWEEAGKEVCTEDPSQTGWAGRQKEGAGLECSSSPEGLLKAQPNL